MGKTKRTFKDVPKEGKLLLILILLLFVSAVLSPIWKGGALNHTIDFAKVWVAWMLTFLLITTFDRLRQIIQIQAASVAVICADIHHQGLQPAAAGGGDRRHLFQFE